MALNKEELKSLMEIPGETRGVVFQTDRDYILNKKGQEGISKIQDTVKKVGYDIDYINARAMSLHPVGLRVISLLVIKDTFGLSDEEIKKMGMTAPKFSFIIKLLMKFFFSVRKIAEKAPEIWLKHYKNAGVLELINLDEEKKEMILRLNNFKVHPLFCKYLEGYFAGVTRLGVKTEKITCEETMCVFRGDPYNEFLIKWE
jgi:hypothetical protein